MTDKMSDVIYVYNRDGKLEARDCSIVVGNEPYIRQDSINVPDGLEDSLSCMQEIKAQLRTHVEFERATALMLALAIVVDAARELQRIKGLK